MNRVCIVQSSDSERVSAEWQSSAVTPQFNVSFSLVSRVSKHLIEFIATRRVLAEGKSPVCLICMKYKFIILIIIIISLGRTLTHTAVPAAIQVSAIRWRLTVTARSAGIHSR